MVKALKKRKLSKPEREFLYSLQLSTDEVLLYELLLLKNIPMTAQQVATENFSFPSAVYRLFYSLEEYGFAVRVARRPVSYKAVEPESSFSNALQLLRNKLEEQLNSLDLDAEQISSPAQILIGREALYRSYVREVDKTKFSVDAHSIGIAFSDDMYRANKLAVKRGVSFRYAFQQYKQENFPILVKWKEIGMELRHYKTEKGFHMMIFDQKKLIISFSDPLDTNNRLSIMTDNNVAVQLFSSYFENVWHSARIVSLSDK